MSMIGPPEIVERALAEARRLGESTNWRPAFVGSVPESPLLVLRRDKKEADFYIVSFRASSRVTARLRMNAHTGRYAEGIGIDKLGDMLKPYYRLDQAERELKKKAKKKQPPPPAPEPFLIWQPCAQSLSPFLPFYRFVEQGEEVYVRVDGRVHRGPLTYGAGL